MEYFTNKYNTSNEKEFYVRHGMIGAPTSPQTANQLQEATSRLNAGVKNVELSIVDPQVFESIPVEHFKEVKRLSELTGSKASLHFPAQIDLAGFQGGQQGMAWSESDRKRAYFQLKSGIDRAADMGNNTILNVHSSGGVPAYEWQAEKHLGEEGYPEEGKRKIYIMDRDSNRVTAAPEYEEKEYFHGKKTWQPKERIKNLNETQWTQEQLQLFNYEKEKAEINDRLDRIRIQTMPLIEGDKKGVLTDQEMNQLQNNIKEINIMGGHIREINQHLNSKIEDLHHMFSKFTPEEDQKKFLNSDEGKVYREIVRESAEKHNLREDEKERERKLISYLKKFDNNEQKAHEALRRDIIVDEQRLINTIQSMPTPKRFVTTDEFAKEKLSKTVSDSAFYAYDEYGKNAPVISVENVMPDWTLGKGDTLREAVLESRKQFAEKLVKEKHMSKPEAGKVAEKLIGATWDVGHIAQLKKFGYTDKQIAREAREIASVVKHVHITDNFGFNDTHLPPGMGTVPIKEQLKEIRGKLGEEEYGKLAHIVEAGGFVAQFKTSPHPETLKYFNSPLYTHKSDLYWNTVADFNTEYNMGYNITFPQKHFETYGAGFSNLPTELGGQAQQKEGSRFSGNAME